MQENLFKVFTPSEYIEVLNEGLSGFSAVVEGEVSEYKVSQQKWIFFKIKDEDSVLDCFSTVFQLKTPLEDGMRVRLYGTPKIHARSGRFSITVQWVEASGEGALKRAFELLKAELEKEGLFAESRKREIPEFPKKIGLIASKESAAYKDFVKVLSERFGGISIYFYDSSVQGEDSVEELCEAFSYFNENQKKLEMDLLVLTRGGGAMEDLKSFNSKEVAYAIFGSLVPVVCGVGHERDVTIADLVADLRASTPSNAAELISPQRSDLKAHINGNLYKIESTFFSILEGEKNMVDGFTKTLESFITSKINDLKGLNLRFFSNFRIFEDNLKNTKERIENAIKFSLKNMSEKLIIHRSKVENFERLLKSLSPKAVLKRGYSIVRSGSKVVQSTKNLKKKDVVDILMHDGEFTSEVLDIKS